jgi:hypothetical protein
MQRWYVFLGLWPAAIAEALGIGRASVYRVLEVGIEGPGAG